MERFETIDNLRSWFDPLGYEAFWSTIAPYEIFTGGDRAHCDQAIADGVVTYDTALEVLKGLARIELTQRQGLTYRSCLPSQSPLQVVR